MAVHGITGGFRAMFKVFKIVFESMWNILKGITRRMIDRFKALGTVIKGVFTLDPDTIFEGLEEFAKADVEGMVKIFTNAKEAVGKTMSVMATDASKSFDKAYKLRPISNIVTDDLDNVIKKVKNKALEFMGLGGLFSGGGEGPSRDTTAIDQRNALESMGTQASLSLSADSTSWLTDLSSSNSWDELNKRFDESNKKIKEMDEKRLQPLKETAATVGTSLQSAFSDVGSTLVQSLGLGESALGSFTATLISSTIDAIGAYLAQSVSASIAAASASSVFAGPAAPIILPALIAGATAAVKGAFTKVPAFAQGGIVSAPTLAMVGDNFGASQGNPEVIAPLNKLEGMMRTNKVDVGGEFRVQGQDLVMALQRANRERGRII